MRIVKWLGIALLLALVAAGVWLWDPVGKTPPADELAAAAAGYDAEIIRDNWGVPHVYGKRDADVAFGIAYAHAEDDYETIQEVVAATRGSLAR
ncbi:MAG: penicillin acylase family protein, partial [Henriciella sp.]